MAPNASSTPWYYPRASINDLRSAVFWRDVVAEFIAVTVLMTTIALVLITNNKDVYPITTTHLGLYAVVLVYLLLEGYGPISGAHMNPAASLSLFLAGKVSLARALVYIAIQTAGSAAGSGIGYFLTPEVKRGDFHAFDPEKHGMTVFQGVAMEAFFAFNLIFVALSCHDTVNRPPAALPALPIACCIGLGILAAGTHTGGLMNPIIAFGPAILSKNFKNHWVYWLGPLLGGPAAVPVYKVLIFIKQKYGPKPAAAALNNETALTKDELIALLNKALRDQDHQSGDKMASI